MYFRKHSIRNMLTVIFISFCTMCHALPLTIIPKEGAELLTNIVLGEKCPSEELSIKHYKKWIAHLKKFRVRQGNAFLMVPSTFPLFLQTFGSCFGNNPASPYIWPQPPIEDSYVDPYYGVPLNTPGPKGSTTNIIYRLSDNDALVTIVSYPPLAAYFGYQSYVFTREADFYANIPPPFPRKISPDPNRYEIFGSIGNDINNVIVQDQYGTTPWENCIVMYITTSNSNTMIF